MSKWVIRCYAYNTGFRVGNVSITPVSQEVVLEWKSNYADDVLAISVIKVISDIGRSARNVKLSKMTRRDALIKVLRNYFVVEEKDDIIKVVHGDKEAYVNKIEVSGDMEIVNRIKEYISKVDAIYL